MHNWDLSRFNNKNVILTGENREMTATAAFLKKHSNANSLVHKFVDLNNLASAYEQFAKPDLSKTILIKSAGVPGSKMGAPYITSTQLFFELIQPLGNITIGVTGTKGKTTTASLIAAMLEQAGKEVILCGNIGQAMIAYLDKATPLKIFVIELSSQQLEELEVSPHIACVTNLYNDHLDYHGSLEAYFEAKHNIVRFMGPDDIFVYNPNFELCREWAKTSQAKSIVINPDEQLDMSKTKLIGDHNRLNAIMAKTVAKQVGANEQNCLVAINSFQPIEHRLEKINTINGVTFIDDAIASQPEAAIAGLEAISKEYGPVSGMLLGGQDRNYDFTNLMLKLYHFKVMNLVLFPDTVDKMKAALPQGYQPAILETKDMNQAVKWAYQRAPKGSVVLLSTGAPSYSLWKDFEHKGNQFQKAIKLL